jgi:mono/diheme cytochrome c family protein
MTLLVSASASTFAARSFVDASGSGAVASGSGAGQSGSTVLLEVVPGAAGAAIVLDPAVVQNCVACHKDALSLEDRTSAELVMLIEEMAAGRVSHLVPLPALSEADRQALAEALASDD